MFPTINPLVLKKVVEALEAVGKTDLKAMGQGLASLDTDSRTLLIRFLIRAAKSGDSSAYVKRHLGRAFREDDAPAAASATSCEAEKPRFEKKPA